MYDRNLRDRQEKAMVDYIIQMVIALSIFKSDYSTHTKMKSYSYWVQCFHFC